MVADVFAIKVCAYAIMSNHYHVGLYVERTLPPHLFLTENVIQLHISPIPITSSPSPVTQMPQAARS